MRTLLIPLLLGATIHPCATLALSGNTPAMPGKGEVVLDSVSLKALHLLQDNLENLMDPAKHRAFSMAFVSGAQHWCDHCVDARHVDIATYLNAIPEGLTFTYVVDEARIKRRMVELGEFEVEIPFRKRVPKVAGGRVVPGSGKWVDLVAHIDMDYNTGSFKIRDVLFDRAPAANVLMLEAAPMLGVGSLKFADEAGALSTGTMGATVGLMYYFSPIAGTNRQNVWMKAGLRAGLRQLNLKGDELVYERNGMDLLATNANPAYSMTQKIDVTRKVTGIKEKTSSTVLELPIGISKRWSFLNLREVDFSLELEVGYGFELARSVEGSYAVDQTGTNHRVYVEGGPADGVLMLQDGGGARTYTTGPEAVQSANNGRIDFFKDQDGSVGVSSSPQGYFLFAINPSVFLRKAGNDRIRWSLGLRLAMHHMNTADGDLDFDYFYREADLAPGQGLVRDTDRTSLSSLSTKRSQAYIGFVVGMNLK